MTGPDISMRFRFSCTGFLLAGALITSPVLGQSGQDAPDDESEFGLMFVDEGVEETYYTCTPCHSEMIVVQQGKTREGWDKLFNWMIEEQGMPELDEETRTVILDYLAKHYNTDRPNFPKR
jgi:cytochrome c